MKIIVIGSLAKSILNFRGELISRLVSLDHGVTAMAPRASAKEIERIEKLGAAFLSYPLERNGMNPLCDIKTLFFLHGLFRRVQPDLILAYNIKPVIWGGIAALFAGKSKFFALITGMGHAFEGQGVKGKVLRTLVSKLYRIALFRSSRVIFQNIDNREFFVRQGIISPARCAIVDGSGVDTDYFQNSPFMSGPPTFLLLARLLGEKGIREYIRAARRAKKRYPHAVFNLLGPEDPSPDGIRLTEIRKWHSEGVIRYLGETEDVRPHIARCHVYVLPSYHEGLPRSVLEAMAMGRPILATDVPGCRETVLHGENGFLVPVRDVDALTERLIWFIENESAWKRMGQRSRDLVKARFDVRTINQRLIRIMGV